MSTLPDTIGELKKIQKATNGLETTVISSLNSLKSKVSQTFESVEKIIFDKIDQYTLANGLSIPNNVIGSVGSVDVNVDTSAVSNTLNNTTGNITSSLKNQISKVINIAKKSILTVFNTITDIIVGISGLLKQDTESEILSFLTGMINKAMSLLSNAISIGPVSVALPNIEAKVAIDLALSTFVSMTKIAIDTALITVKAQLLSSVASMGISPVEVNKIIDDLKDEINKQLSIIKDQIVNEVVGNININTSNVQIMMAYPSINDIDK